MVNDATPGESAGHRACRFLPIRTALRRAAIGCVLILGLGAAPAFAGSLYRCVGTTGETVFSGSTAGYKDCKRIGSTPGARPARSAVAKESSQGRGRSGAAREPQSGGPDAAAPASQAAQPGSFRGVLGSVVSAPSTAAFAGVSGDVVGEGEGQTLPPVTAPRGSWDYRESATQDLTASLAPAAPKGSRVLRGAVYRITRPDGGVEYTNIPPGGAAKGQSIKMLFTYIATCAACDVHSRIDWNNVALNLTSFGDAIRSASGEFGVDEALLRAVIHAESAFNPRALSVAGAQGLMQLIPGTARDMGVLDAFDVNQNIRGGARYLALLLRNFNGNERLAAAAYNAGPGAVQKYNGVPPYDETQVYVERVGVLRKRYAETLKRHAAAGVPLADRGA
ncbi:lytic transglycosylase domain-containing protein [Luteibacter sp. SG786]|uniref:lytic transglycosylase domain-containing protein n=1 Tax=Luteibacter sp. SG786 TaxID=2587130 RepID=UPI00141E8483|nr:lytic transglycosylase domain-containing protein [Luteibacter sp. SG786]NII53167.1 hypothetical protein [Luteibacter sp. SG786]